MQTQSRLALVRSLGISFTIALASAGVVCAVPPSAAFFAEGLTVAQPHIPVHVPTPVLVAEVEGDIVDVATAHGSFRAFTDLLDQLGMAEDLRGYGRFTVFAPTDAAFRAMPQSILEPLLDDRELMAKVLAYHVVSSGTPLSARALRSVGSLTTLERSPIELDRRNGKLYVNEARVVEADLEASNGVIHAIDQVLIPPDVMSQIAAGSIE